MMTSEKRGELLRPRRGRYSDSGPHAIKEIPSGHGGTIEVPDPVQDYLYDIALSLRQIVDALTDYKGK